MTTTDTNDAIDWEACWGLATQLGARTRMLIVERDYEGAREWALQMASAHSNASPANGTRAISYFELAVLLGHRAREVQEDARLDWDALLAKVSALQRSVKEKADAEKATRKPAARSKQEEVSGGERDDS